MPELASLVPGDPATTGPYRLEGRLGSGGQGTVYAGRGPDGVLVAIKLLHPHLITDGQARARFLREVETAKRVAPFCTAQMLDTGFAEARPYIVSELVDGPSLQDSVRENGPRGAAALQRLAINTATALASIHAAGVVHRDFKPGNVLLGPDGPVVIDFGIAKALDLSQSLVSSQPIGSPAYMAPEQIADGEVGPPADLFAWAATMYYAATGNRAFGGEAIPSTLHAVLQSEPDVSGLEVRFRRLLQECLAKDPSRRPTAAQVVERLRALPVPAWQSVPAGTAGRRRTLAVAAGAAALVVTAACFYALGPATAQQQAAGPALSPSVSPPAATPMTTGSRTPHPEASLSAMMGEEADLARSPAAAAPTKAPRTRTTATREPDPTPDGKHTVAPTTARPSPKPTAKSTPKPSSSKETTAPPKLPPSTGTLTWNDVTEYCKTQGYTSYSYGGWADLRCAGSDTKLDPSALCRWKYPDYARAEGELPANMFVPSATCHLS
ncbi:serine/threonine-protein kinase [Nonomuraea zeae]|uniref:serine/threonine-protein kinase n=1 Tax=Nonomuraea zeae TaxID=1642303 RepID=UPI001478DDB5|nr:serine/threonine-protein kinase [Nonomuraea zeae]